MQMIKKGIRLTKHTPRSKMHNISVTSIETNRFDTIHDVLQNLLAMDITGRFPVTSAQGYKYIFIMYDFDSGYIKPIAMKSRKSDELVWCYKEGHSFFCKAGFQIEQF